MVLEIERRFLIQGDAWEANAGDGQQIRQGYLISSTDHWTVRVRILRKDKAWITLKSPAKGISVNEFEYLIPVNDAEKILDLLPNKLTKTRYPLNLQGGDWIVDCFEGKNYPLVIAEVELTSTKQKIKQPSWCFKEVTKYKQLSNAALAQKPISDWSKEDLMTIHLK